MAILYIALWRAATAQAKRNSSDAFSSHDISI